MGRSSRTRKKMDAPKRFVFAWERSESCSEAAAYLGAPALNVWATAWHYIAAGVPLKRLPFRSFDADLEHVIQEVNPDVVRRGGRHR